MRSTCRLIKRSARSIHRHTQKRNLLTLAIETSCDDTSVALLEKCPDSSAILHFHSKITSDNRSRGGIYPIIAHESHQKNVAGLIGKALQHLPCLQHHEVPNLEKSIYIEAQNPLRQKPDFVTVTRGPGMRASLITGVDTAKGLAVAWQIPLLGVNHMQAHALTPRLVSALNRTKAKGEVVSQGNLPSFPFMTFLVSGGHTMLVHSKSLCDHEILANTIDVAIGDFLDKCARDILPKAYIEGAENVMYARIMEKFVFPDEFPEYNYTPPTTFMRKFVTADHGFDWTITPPFAQPGPDGATRFADSFSFSGLGGKARQIAEKTPNMSDEERRTLAKVVMSVAFEHLASRLLLTLKMREIDMHTLVVSGGVASNRYLKAILRAVLDTNGYEHVNLVFPPPEFCTDNAAMIAWTGIEMYEAGYRTSMDAIAVAKWAIDPRAPDGGILGGQEWLRAGDPL